MLNLIFQIIRLITNDGLGLLLNEARKRKPCGYLLNKTYNWNHHQQDLQALSNDRGYHREFIISMNRPRVCKREPGQLG